MGVKNILGNSNFVRQLLKMVYENKDLLIRTKLKCIHAANKLLDIFKCL